MKNLYIWLTASKRFVLAHKVWSGVIALVLLYGAWWGYGSLTSTAGQTRYVLGTVAKATVISSVSGSGQVSASQQLNITSQVSGQVVYVGVVPGQKVSAGTLIAEIDPTDAVQQVKTAKQNLQSAQIALAKIKQPATTLTITQQQNAIDQATQSLATQYQSSFADIISTFVDLPTIISGVQDIDTGTQASKSSWNIDFYLNAAMQYNPNAKQYRDAAYNDYLAARLSYDKTFIDFKSAPSTPDTAAIEKLLDETYKTTAAVATAVKSANNLIQFYSDQVTQAGATPIALSATHITSLNSFSNKAQTHLSTLLTDANALQNYKSSIIEKQQTLAQTQTGADTLDIQTAELTVAKAQDTLDQANINLAKYYIRAPFSGTVGAVGVHRFDQAGSASIASIVTTQQMADLSLNEIDAAKIQLGNKVTLTFDAIPSLTLTGTIAQINSVGTVTQGVVTYEVKISFDSQDPRIKSGMTVNTSIQTAVHPDVLTVPQSSVKTQNGQSYVLVFDPPLATSSAPTTGAQAGVLSVTAPQQIPVTIGISDDTSIEIISGLTEGQQVVTRTVSGSAAASTQSGGSLFGGTRAGASSTRIPSTTGR